MLVVLTLSKLIFKSPAIMTSLFISSRESNIYMSKLVNKSFIIVNIAEVSSPRYFLCGTQRANVIHRLTH